MLKQVGILAASVLGIALVFAMGMSDSPEPQPAGPEVVEPEAKPEPKPQSEEAEDDYWGDEEALDEEFAFGEPMVSTEPDVKLDDSYDAFEDPAAGSSSASNSVGPAQRPSLDGPTPEPGEPGSRENPINLSGSETRT